MSAQFQARGLGCVPGSWRRPRSSPQLTQHEAWVAFRLRGERAQLLWCAGRV